MAKLEIIESNESLTHIALTGRLDLRGVHDVELEFTIHTAGRRKPTIVDLSGVDFLASLGLGMLLCAARSLRDQKAQMVLLKPTTLVNDVLQTARIHDVLPIVSELADARVRLGVS